MLARWHVTLCCVLLACRAALGTTGEQSELCLDFEDASVLASAAEQAAGSEREIILVASTEGQCLI